MLSRMLSIKGMRRFSRGLTRSAINLKLGNISGATIGKVINL